MCENRREELDRCLGAFLHGAGAGPGGLGADSVAGLWQGSYSRLYPHLCSSNSKDKAQSILVPQFATGNRKWCGPSGRARVSCECWESCDYN